MKNKTYIQIASLRQVRTFSSSLTNCPEGQHKKRIQLFITDFLMSFAFSLCTKIKHLFQRKNTAFLATAKR